MRQFEITPDRLALLRSVGFGNHKVRQIANDVKLPASIARGRLKTLWRNGYLRHIDGGVDDFNFRLTDKGKKEL